MKNPNSVEFFIIYPFGQIISSKHPVLPDFYSLGRSQTGKANVEKERELTRKWILCIKSTADNIFKRIS